jgi:hypothetical protein
MKDERAQYINRFNRFSETASPENLPQLRL